MLHDKIIVGYFIVARFNYEIGVEVFVTICRRRRRRRDVCGSTIVVYNNIVRIGNGRVTSRAVVYRTFINFRSSRIPSPPARMTTYVCVCVIHVHRIGFYAIKLVNVI